VITDRLASAAQTTLDAGTARIRRTRLNAAGEAWTTDEGVTDFAARRTRVQVTHGPQLQERIERLGEQIDERWPWLFGESDADDAPHVAVYAGTAAVHGSGGTWSQLAPGDHDADQRHHGDPAWLLEALTRAHVESTATADPGRYAFELNLTRLHGELELPPHRGSTPPRLGGEAWLDEDGRLARLVWRNVTYVRRPRQEGEPPSAPGSQRLELWDFGLPVQIDVPELPHRRRGAGLVEWVQIGRDMRRRRREYRESTP
jgi:hypothetical protein